MAFRSLDTSGFAKQGLKFTSQPGDKPELQWVAIDKLVIDDSYQREVGKHGISNVRRIANEFRWSHLEPIVVAPVTGGRFAVINGQHRALGARLRGIKEIPCAVVKADQAEQAAAFAAINGNVTAITPLQLFHSGLAAKLPEHIAVSKLCEAAGVRIRRSVVANKDMKAGDTLAASSLLQCYRQYGPQTLQLALECITRTGGGNLGLVRHQIIKAICAAIKEFPAALRMRDRVVKNVEGYGVSDIWNEARAEAVRLNCSVQELLTQAFRGVVGEVAVQKGKAA
jgi:hypothetical protein